jgi:hypothetical protein
MFAPDIQKAFGGRLLFEESKTEAYEQGELPLGPLGSRGGSAPATVSTDPAQGTTISPYL